MLYPDLRAVTEFSKRYNRIPVYKKLNLSSPGFLMLLKSLQSKRDIIFLESARYKNKKMSRFSYLGFNPLKVISFNPPNIIERIGDNTRVLKMDYFAYLKEETARYSSPTYHQFGTFNGGLVGYFGFELVNYTGILRRPIKEDASLPQSVLIAIDDFLCYDNKEECYYAATSIYTDTGTALDEQYRRAVAHLSDIEADVISRITKTSLSYIPSMPEMLDLTFRESIEEFAAKVSAVKQLITDGEAIQVVMSMRGDINEPIDPYVFYLRLREVNPSPYMYFLKFDTLCIVGSSPEIHVRVTEDLVSLKPIAGTIAQGKTARENKKNKELLLANPKERAEHLMLVDLARNDLARIALPGSVEVHEFMQPEDYSHVIHLVSMVTGRLGPGRDAVDVLRETYPAGTVSGAPKVRALEIIDQFESHARGMYAGAIGYIGFNGYTDTCITIRTAYFTSRGNFIQAGAGIVYDSVPESEYHEIKHKLQALAASLPFAKITSQGGAA